MLQRFKEVWSCTTSAAQWCIANKTLICNDGAWTYNITASGKSLHTLQNDCVSFSFATLHPITHERLFGWNGD